MLQNAIMCKPKQHVVYICGDTNARTGTYDDYICMDTFEEEIAGLTSSYDTTTRKNIDPKLNTYGRKLLSLCKQTSVQIQNGRLSESKYTCLRPNGASSVDYLLTTLENSKYLAYFNVLDRDIYSDHCPLSFCLHANKCMSLRRELKPIHKSYKWNSKYRNISRKRLTDSAAKFMRTNFLCNIVTHKITPNEVVKNFKALIEQAAYNLFKLKKNKRTCTFPVNEWFDYDCKAAKSRLRKYKDHEVGTDGYKEYWKLKQIM